LLPCELSSILSLNVCKISVSSPQMHCFGLIYTKLPSCIASSLFIPSFLVLWSLQCVFFLG
jgi:hypothetical protein